MDSTETCVLCNKILGGPDAASRLGPKGSAGVNKASAERGDKISASPGQFIHTECRKRYCNPIKIKHDMSNKSLIPEAARVPSLRSSETFSFKDKCLFCGLTAKLSGNKRGHDVFPVRTLDFQERIQTVCNKRADEWAESVSVRLQTVNDLPAADALYHQNCSVRFRTMKTFPVDRTDFSPEKKLRGRPVTSIAKESFQSIIQYLEENEREMITIKDLVEKMKEGCGEEAFSAKYMKQKLVDHFGDSIAITDLKGKSTVVTLKHTASNILHKFYMQENEDNETKKKTIIETAAKLIKCDIKSLESNKTEYPLPSDISSVEKNTYQRASKYCYKR